MINRTLATWNIDFARFFLGAVDATVHQALAQRYGIQGYPTIKYFKAGKKGSPEDYDGGRTASDIVAWAEERNVVNLPPPEVGELTNQKTLEEQCDGKQLCIVGFLPHILDSQVSHNVTQSLLHLCGVLIVFSFWFTFGDVNKQI